jgi:hypothetical protein
MGKNMRQKTEDKGNVACPEIAPVACLLSFVLAIHGGAAAPTEDGFGVSRQRRKWQ